MPIAAVPKPIPVAPSIVAIPVPTVPPAQVLPFPLVPKRNIFWAATAGRGGAIDIEGAVTAGAGEVAPVT